MVCYSYSYNTQSVPTWEAQNSIIITWQISFEHIRRSRPSATDLLSLMSLFDRQSIPEVLIRNWANSGKTHRNQEERNKYSIQEKGKDDNDRISERSDDFENNVQIMRDYLFVSINTDRTFEMHALVEATVNQKPFCRVPNRRARVTYTVIVTKVIQDCFTLANIGEWLQSEVPTGVMT